jgi:putative membrane protein
MLRRDAADVHRVRQNGSGMRANITWTLSPGVLIGAVLLSGVYVRRWWQVRTASPRGQAEAPVWRLCCFAGSVAIALAALVSPVDSLADQLLDLVPILAIVGLTKVILRPVTRTVHDLERRAGVLAHPAFAVLLYIAVIWAWHVPSAYDFAVRHPFVHVLEHLSFVVAGSLYWWHLLSPIRGRMRLQGLGPVVYMASTKLFVGALGMALAFAPSALYPYYEHLPRVWGLSAGEDQSVAGLIMAVEQSIVMGVALVVLFVRALTESEREQQRRERYGLV